MVATGKRIPTTPFGGKAASSVSDDNPDRSGTLASSEAVAIRQVIVGTPGVQSVGDVRALTLQDGRRVITARLGFGPSSPVVDIVAVLHAVRSGIRRAVPDAHDIVLEPEVAPPRTDANPPTDVFVIRGAD